MAAINIFNINQTVIACGTRGRQMLQINIYRTADLAIIRRISATTAKQGIVAKAPAQGIVANTPVENVVGPITAQAVIACTPNNVFNPHQRVATRRTGRRPLAQINVNVTIGIIVMDGIGPGTAIDIIVARTTTQLVIAIAAQQIIIAIQTANRVVAFQPRHGVVR